MAAKKPKKAATPKKETKVSRAVKDGTALRPAKPESTVAAEPSGSAEKRARRNLDERAVGVGVAVPYKEGGVEAGVVPLGGGGKPVKAVVKDLKRSSQQFKRREENIAADEIVVAHEPVPQPPQRPRGQNTRRNVGRSMVNEEKQKRADEAKGLGVVPAPAAADVESVVEPQDRTPLGTRTTNLDLGEVTTGDMTKERRELSSKRNQPRRARLGLGDQKGVAATARIRTRKNKTAAANKAKDQAAKTGRASAREVSNSLFKTLRDEKTSELGLGSHKELTEQHLAEIRGSMTPEALQQHAEGMEWMKSRGLTKAGGTRGANSPMDAPKPKPEAQTVTTDDLVLDPKGRASRAIEEAGLRAGVHPRHVRTFLAKNGIRDEAGVVGLFSVLGQTSGRERNNNSFVAESSKTVKHPVTGASVPKCASPDCKNPAEKRAQVETSTKFSSRLARDTKRTKKTSTSVPLCPTCHAGHVSGSKKLLPNALDITQGTAAAHPLISAIAAHGAAVEAAEQEAHADFQERKKAGAKSGAEAIAAALDSAHSADAGAAPAVRATPVYQDARNQLGKIEGPDALRTNARGKQFVEADTQGDLERAQEVAARQASTGVGPVQGSTDVYTRRSAAPLGPKRPSPDKPTKPGK